MAHDPTAAAPSEAGWRIRVGGAVFPLSIVGPVVLLPLMAAARLEAATTAAISGAILGSAELLGLGEGLSLAIVGDLMWILSLFVLGGDFWDKLRALFVYGAVASFPGQAHLEG